MLLCYPPKTAAAAGAAGAGVGALTWHEEGAGEARAGRFGRGIPRRVPVVISCAGGRSIDLKTQRHTASLQSQNRTWSQLKRLKIKQHASTTQDGKQNFADLFGILQQRVGVGTIHAELNYTQGCHENVIDVQVLFFFILLLPH